MGEFDPEQVEAIIQALSIYPKLEDWMKELFLESGEIAMNDENISLDRRWKLRARVVVVEAEKVAYGRGGST